jgi:hypothetical protein
VARAALSHEDTMFASIIWDAFAGFGCMTFSFLLIVTAVIAAALRLGILPGLAEALRKLKEKPDG